MKPNTKKLLKHTNIIKTLPINEERKVILQPLINHLQKKIKADEPINITFICTHNSRRSILGQVWFQTLAHTFGLKNIYSYSGGTEGTTVAKPIIETLKKQGFGIETLAETTNPIYSIKFSENNPAIIGFSKVFDHDFNPQSKFTALMVCSQADKGCPFVPGTEKRIAITYEDPKLFDNTDQQDEKYTERSLQIASEMYYVLSELKF